MSQDEEYEYEYESNSVSEEAEYEYEYGSSEEADSAEDGSSDSEEWDSDASDDGEVAVVKEDDLTGKSKFEIALLKWGKRPGEETKVKGAKPKTSTKSKAKKKDDVVQEEAAVKKVAFDITKDLTPEDMLQWSRDITLAKWRKQFGDIEVKSALEPAIAYSAKFGPHVELEVISGSFSLLNDSLRRGKFEVASLEDFCTCFDMLNKLIECFLRDPMSQLLLPLDDLDWKSKPTWCEETIKERQIATYKAIAFGIEALDDEYRKAFQLMEHHDDSYRQTLEVLPRFLATMWRIIMIAREYEHLAPYSCNAITKFTYHCHYRSKKLALATFDAVRAFNADLPEVSDPMHLYTGLFVFVAQNAPVSKPGLVVAMKLYYIFAAVQSDLYTVGTQLLIGGQLHEAVVAENDVQLQIFYNRAVVACGLAAFRKGNTNEAHNFLQDICSFTRQRELLAQGLSNSKGGYKSEEADRQERARLLPYHMHLNPDVIEQVHNLSAMILVAPLLAKQTTLNPAVLKSVNRHFVYMLEVFLRSPTNLPPESARDTCISCLLDLAAGKCDNVLSVLGTMRVWSSIESESYNKTDMFENFSQELRKCGLTCYVSAFHQSYKSLQVADLSRRFKLSETVVQQRIGKLVYSKIISGSWSEGNLHFLLNKADYKGEGASADKLVENLTNLLDNTDHLQQLKNPAYLASSLSYHHRN